MAIYLETYHEFKHLTILVIPVTIPLGIIIIPSLILEKFLRNPKTLRIRFGKKIDAFEIEKDKIVWAFQNRDVHLVRESEDRIEIEVDSHSFSLPKEWSTGNLRSAY